MFGLTYNILAWLNGFTSCFSGLFSETEGTERGTEPHPLCAASLMTGQNMVQ